MEAQASGGGNQSAGQLKLPFTIGLFAAE